MNVNSWIAIGSLALQIMVTVLTVTNSASDIRSDVAVLKNQISWIQQTQQELKRQIEVERK